VSNKSLYAHLAVLSANLIYGANYTIAKQVMPQYIQPFGFIFIRVLVTAIIFFVIGTFGTNEKVDRKDIGRLFLCAVFGVAINQLLFFKGLDLTTPIIASLMMTTNPIMVLVVASIIIRERITIRKITGIIIGIVGASTLLLWGKTASFSSASALGDFFILVNSLSWGVFLIIVRPLMQKYNTITVMKWVFLFGSLLVFPFGWEQFKIIEWNTFDAGVWMGVFYVVICTTSVAYMLNTFALKNLSPSTVSAYIYLQPLFATAIAILIGKDHLNILHIISALLIFTGVYLVSTGNFKEMAGRFLSLKKD
jgi:drug/metabolite transporter (DMT)-like permease